MNLVLLGALLALGDWPWNTSEAIKPSGANSYGTSAPATCTTGDYFYKTTLPGRGAYDCTATNTWTQQGPAAGGLPSGVIVMIISGTCPTGFTEVAALNGKTIVGTVAANANVGTTGGSDTITPAGTFTGNAWTPPAIAWPAGVPTYSGALGTLAVTAHTVVSTKQGTSAGNVVTTATHAFTGVPGGTVAWPAGVPTIGAYTPTGSFSGTQFDNRSAFVRAIFCSKD